MATRKETVSGVRLSDGVREAIKGRVSVMFRGLKRGQENIVIISDVKGKLLKASLTALLTIKRKRGAFSRRITIQEKRNEGATKDSKITTKTRRDI